MNIYIDLDVETSRALMKASVLPQIYVANFIQAGLQLPISNRSTNQSHQSTKLTSTDHLTDSILPGNPIHSTCLPGVT